MGDTNGKKLVAYCGGVEEIFKESRKNLMKIPGISSKIVDAIIHNKEILSRAEKEEKFIEDNQIQPLFFLDKEYPQRLKQCADGPILLYFKGNANLNYQRTVSIVGTRTPSLQGRHYCEKLITDLKQANVQIISGLAYGIDICAHKNSLKNSISTVGVLGSGLDWIYPGNHKSIAEEMLENGGLLTEFVSGTKPDRQNFPMRNRIVAGMSDVIVVVESGNKGGSLITANLGFGYNRDIAAFPGRPDDEMAKGCNALIKGNIAALIESGKDLLKIMNWEIAPKKPGVQRSIFVEFNETERILFDILKDGKLHTIDSLSVKSGLPMSKTSSALLGMEFNGIVKALPGKSYQLVS